MAADACDTPGTLAELAAWFENQVADDWFVAPVEIVVDRDEILVTGALSCPRSGAASGDAEHVEQATTEAFREATRDQRIAVAQRAEALYGRKVSWAATCGSTRTVFTSLSVPVMTRLRMDERVVLDTLVAAGVARSRSDALGWCVRLVATNEEAWIERLRDAISAVDQVRAEGPAAG